MIVARKHRLILLIAFILLPFVCWMHLTAGTIRVDFTHFWDGIFNYNSTVTEQLVAREIRIPRMVMSLISGGGLAVAGLLMQTLFNNPLAGPYVLGINSGASLFVAFSMMTGIPLLSTDLGIVTNALIGAFVFGLIILLFSEVVRSQISLLLVGLMLGSFTSAIVSLLQSASGLEQLKGYTLWTFGSLTRTDLGQLPTILAVFLIGIFLSFLLIKPLNLLVTGYKNAALMGMNYRRVRLLIIVVTAVLTGLITAYCGPIAFVGLAVPNLIRLLMKTQHHGILLIACLVFGALFVLLCDTVIQYLEASLILIPINVFTSLIGAPIVVLLLLRRLK